VPHEKTINPIDRGTLGYLATEMVARCNENRWPPPRELVALLHKLLGANTFAARAPTKKELGWANVTRYKAGHPDATPREIAKWTAQIPTV
jgi:hypothetical protein